MIDGGPTRALVWKLPQIEPDKVAYLANYLKKRKAILYHHHFYVEISIVEANECHLLEHLIFFYNLRKCTEKLQLHMGKLLK